MSFRISGKDSIAVPIPVLRRPVGFRASTAALLLTQRVNGSAHQRANSPRVTHFSISLIGIFGLGRDRGILAPRPAKTRAIQIETHIINWTKNGQHITLTKIIPRTIN